MRSVAVKCSKGVIENRYDTMSLFFRKDAMRSGRILWPSRINGKLLFIITIASAIFTFPETAADRAEGCVTVSVFQF
jgi:hypothetical protein